MTKLQECVAWFLWENGECVKVSMCQYTLMTCTNAMLFLASPLANFPHPMHPPICAKLRELAY